MYLSPCILLAEFFLEIDIIISCTYINFNEMLQEAQISVLNILKMFQDEKNLQNEKLKR